MQPESHGSFFKAGGSLASDFPSYVVRPADEELYDQLKSGEFCYVLTARQMGKSSLRVRAMDKLQSDGFLCCAIDITSIGSHNTTVEQWYYSFLFQIDDYLNLGGDLRAWWKAHSDLTLTSRLQAYWEHMVLAKTDKSVIIFLDEIDSVLSLDEAKFSTNDFFASLRAVYNLRASAPQFRRLNFAVFGVAMPNDLMQDPERTPFNVGVSISLGNFDMEDAQVLAKGFSHVTDRPLDLLKWVLRWTNGQPYLTQRLCLSLSQESHIPDFEQVVKRHLDQLFLRPEVLNQDSNLSNVQQRILSNTRWNTRMLDVYARIRKGDAIQVDNRNPAHLYLKLSGLVLDQDHKLEISNKIYEWVFDEEWIWQVFLRIDRPFTRDLQRWVDAGKSEDALLKGQFLENALDWAKDREDLTTEERAYLKASEIAEVQDQERDERLKERERQRKNLLVALIITGILFLFSVGAGLSAFISADQTNRQKIIADSAAQAAQDSATVAREQRLIALIEAENARRKEYQADSSARVADSAARVADRARQNESIQRLRSDFLLEVSIAQRDSIKLQLRREKSSRILLIAQGIQQENPTLALQLLKYAYDRDTTFYPSLLEAPAEELISKEILYRLWGSETNMDLFRVLGKEIPEIYYTKKDRPGLDATRVYPWSNTSSQQDPLFKGHRLPIRSMAFSPDDNYLVTGSKDHSAILWNLSTQTQILLSHEADVVAISFSQDGQWILTGDLENQVRIWDLAGNLKFLGTGPKGDILHVALSPDNKTILGASSDKYVYVWPWQGDYHSEPTKLGRHSGRILTIGFLSNDRALSVGENRKTYFWDVIQLQRLDSISHNFSFELAAFAPGSHTLVAACHDKRLRRWDVRKKIEIEALKLHKTGFQQLAFGPDEQSVFTLSQRGHLYEWNTWSEMDHIGLSNVTVLELNTLEELCMALPIYIKETYGMRTLEGLVPEVCY